ncbi:DUF5667 domain-containing protein, partial [Actinoplanes sp. NPDC051633]|uniref:DUF5667 domain-containing protein n=1 Tax=Actinoplanes sp. NPDC051633 TaxID=3155670 RepID=UPI003446A903
DKRRRIRSRGAIVAGIAAGAMAVSGIAAADGESRGDALYDVIRITERAQPAFTSSDVTRGQLSLDFARNRLKEAASLPAGEAGLPEMLDDMDADTREGVRLLTGAAVAQRDPSPLARIDAFVVDQQGQLRSIADQATGAGRIRVNQSLAVVSKVRQRSHDLRAGLSCEPVPAHDTDSLGPLLKTCPAEAGEKPARPRDRTTPEPSHSANTQLAPMLDDLFGDSAINPGVDASDRPAPRAGVRHGQ